MTNQSNRPSAARQREDSRPCILYLHGFASSSQGAKAQFLSEQFRSARNVTFHALDFNPTPADFEFMTITGLINRLRQHILEHPSENLSLIGSSLGGLVALHYAHRFGGVRKMLLLAPALIYQPRDRSEMEIQQWKSAGKAPIFHFGFGREVPLRYDIQRDSQSYVEAVPPAAATLIIHGRRDAVVPIAESRDYAARHDPVQLIEVDSDHTLNDHLPFIWEQLSAFLLTP